MLWLAARLALIGLMAAALSCASGERGPPLATTRPPTASSPAAHAAGAAGFAVPFADAPAIDGQVDEREWSRAAAISLGRGVSLHIMHDGVRVYLATSGLDRSDGIGFGCLFIAEPDQIRVLHASAKLGSAIYTRAAGGTFRPRSRTYDWRRAELLLREEGWMASTMRMEGSREQEFALTFERLGLPESPRPVAFGYFFQKPDATDLSTASALVWPSGLNDAVAEVELLAGYNPDGLRFEPNRWVFLQPQSR